MSHTADIFDERESWGRPLTASLAVHVLIAVIVSGWAWISVHYRGGEKWGSQGAGGGAISVTAVNSIPLPAPPETQNTNVLANENKGLTQSPPKQEVKPPDDAIAISGKTKKGKESNLNSNKPVPQQQPAPSNQVAYGQGGPANSVTFTMGSGTGGLSVNGTGDFEGLYAWYVENMKRIISQNWAMYGGATGAPKGAKVTISFEVDRSGRPSKIAVETASGSSILDQSATRALQRVDTFGPLPNAYGGNSVLVHFSFEAQ